MSPDIIQTASPAGSCRTEPTADVGRLLSQYLRDLERIDPRDCFFAAMGQLHAERSA